MNAKNNTHIFNLKSYFTFGNAVPSIVNVSPRCGHNDNCQT
jgi:hypothetical protein